MKRLIIDDLRIFHFEDAVYARTSAEAIDQLFNHGPWEQVWWDHDLGGDDTAVRVLNWILYESDAKALTTWFSEQLEAAEHYVHTANPVGADRISGQLRDWGCTVTVLDAQPMLTGWIQHE